MNIIIASVFLIFLNKMEERKVLAVVLIIYLVTAYYVRASNILTFQDYINFYSVMTLALCALTIYLTEMKVILKTISMLVVIPQVFYIYILYKPYALPLGVPMWFLMNADYIFMYGVFSIAYEQSVTFNMSKLCFKEYLLNMCILVSLILF